MTKQEMRSRIIAETLWFKLNCKPIIPVDLASNSPDQKSIRIRPGFRNNGEPMGVFARLELFSVTMKNGRVMQNGMRPNKIVPPIARGAL